MHFPILLLAFWVLLIAGATASRPLAASGWQELPAREEFLRSLAEDGPAWILTEEERVQFVSSNIEARAAMWEAFLQRSPDGAKVERAVLRRLARVRALGFAPADARLRLYWLQGEPVTRETLGCSAVTRPIELWSYRKGERTVTAVLYQPRGRPVFQLWLPTESKRVLYEADVEYFLEQYEEIKRSLGATRPDVALCKEIRKLDQATGVEGLFGFQKERPGNRDFLSLLDPPQDLLAWADRALAEPEPPEASLPKPQVSVAFPALRDQRLEASFGVELPPGFDWKPLENELGRQEVRVIGTARIEREGMPFEEFRVRFVFELPAAAVPVRLEFRRWLRPLQRYVLRLRLEEEATSRQVWIDRGFQVPGEAHPGIEPKTEGWVRGEELGLERRLERETVVLIPPPQEIVFGLQRFEAIVVGDRIRKLRFSLDGKPQVTRAGPPWGAELRLAPLPQETLVRVEGLSETGEVLATDDLLLNQPRSEPRIRLLEPKRGVRLEGNIRARATVVVPEDRQLQVVEFVWNGQVVARLTEPPWEAVLDTSGAGDLTYLSVTARFADGSTVEDVRVFGREGLLEELNVELVELYVSVTDRDGKIVTGLGREQFVLEEEGRFKGLQRFEEVTALPLRLGMVFDASGSMREVLELARQAAVGFLRSVLTAKDLGFTVAFSDRPRLLIPLISDPGALELSLRDIVASGNTALHDAIVLGLYQLRGQRGQRALVLLSDGEDTASTVSFEDTLNFARASGVSIYTIGLNIQATSLGIRSQLARLASETGGRVFYVDQAEALPAIYRQIEEELRSRYLLAFAPDPSAAPGQFRRLEVKLRKSGLKARHAPGYAREP